jgi:uncharacterized SAM-binding protein YcdF (DUF218 family)
VFYVASKVGWFLATPSNLLPLLILVGLALVRLKRPRLGWRIATSASLLLIVIGLSPVSNWLVLPLEARFPSFRDDGKPVTGVIVLGGTVQAEETLAREQLTLNEAGERLIALADLGRRYPEARLVFSGGGGTLIEEQAAEAAGLERFLGTLGLPAQRVLFEDRSRTTSENAVLTRALVEPKAGERWLLVTSAAHMPRAVGCFRQAGFPVTAYPVDYRTRDTSDLLRPFGAVTEGLRRLEPALKEWIGLLAYRLAGHTDALFPAPSSEAGGSASR